MFGKKGRDRIGRACISHSIIKHLITYMESISPGIVFMLEQYYRYNYSEDRSLWYDVLANSPGEFIKVVREYYDIRMEYGEFIIYEILRAILRNDVLKVGEIMELIRKGKFSDINKLVCSMQTL